MTQEAVKTKLTSHEVNTGINKARFITALRRGLELLLVRFSRNGRTRRDNHLGELPADCPLIHRGEDGFPKVGAEEEIPGECVLIETNKGKGVLTPACSSCGKRGTCNLFTNGVIVATELDNPQLEYTGLDRIQEIKRLRAITNGTPIAQIHHSNPIIDTNASEPIPSWDTPISSGWNANLSQAIEPDLLETQATILRGESSGAIDERLGADAVDEDLEI